VGETDDIFRALELQDDLQCCYTGGTVLHAFVGEAIDDVRTVRSLVRKITGNFRLPYFTITPTFSVCADHGYISGEEPVCPQCQNSTEVYSRVVGYLRPVSRWNDGTQEEYAQRRTYKVQALTMVPAASPAETVALKVETPPAEESEAGPTEKTGQRKIRCA
jgi:ribonucleoside-triphosphate reductase